MLNDAVRVGVGRWLTMPNNYNLIKISPDSPEIKKLRPGQRNHKKRFFTPTVLKVPENISSELASCFLRINALNDSE